MADDDPNDVALVARLFTDARLLNTLQVVSSGEKSIQYLAGVRDFADRQKYPFPSLLLLDLKMPGKNGFDVLSWLLDHPESRPASVVVLATNGELKDINLAYQLGANSFLVKPMELEEFLNLLNGLKGARMHSSGAGRTLEFA